ncbi:MAG: PAS domain S-box protein [Lentisphaerae bacterium]|jgi:signal transduction histidine kinase/HAMP domain-containing protein|nr:PAS domain S-box protein [Lentisphaerota bacterium]MBT4815645.1 PAS domain S-box protein [Lentisphaerota bacterium]MBT5613037.1 PAS domain S-box protein [Lentisphaerota bacterium]MBT7056717.1 PAS domain S-box protein [Lentisphaerota bacterium]MBT7843765.1 PAS domain S-box protein [Lentisphaerota bacterium]
MLSTKKLPLSLAVSVPFLVLTTLAVFLAGYLSFRNGRAAVEDMEARLCGQIAGRIQDRLRSFLRVPSAISGIDAHAVGQGTLRADDVQGLLDLFGKQLQTFESVSSIYFGNTRGGLVDRGREPSDGSHYVMVTEGLRKGTLTKHVLDSEGNRTTLQATVPDFDATSRPWYTRAVAQRGVTWSPVYVLSTGQDMAIAASHPVHDPQGVLLGVVSVDVFLSHICRFLADLGVGTGAECFIAERSGLLVASSADEKPFVQVGDAGKPGRLSGNGSRSPIICAAFAALAEGASPPFGTAPEAQRSSFEVDGERYLLDLAPLRSAQGLDWLVGVVVPESEYMSRIRAGNRQTRLLIVATLFLAIVVGLVAELRITRPIGRLHAATHSLSEGESPEALGDDSSIREISGLTRAFDGMSKRLRQTLYDLRNEISERTHAEEALRDSEQRYRTLYDSSEEAIMILAPPSWQFTAGNPATVALFRTGTEGLFVSAPPWEWSPEYQPDGRGSEEKAREMIEAALREGSRWFEWQHRRHDGEEFPAAVRLTRMSLGESVFLQATVRDISGRKAAEERQRQLEGQLRQAQKLEAIGTLAGGVAHEINNPINGIMNYAQLIIDRLGNGNEAIAGFAGEIIHETDRVATLVRNLLQFARNEQQPQSLTRIADVVDATLSLTRTIVARNRVTLEVDVPDDLPHIVCQGQQIEQVLVNLLTNAHAALSEEPPGRDEPKTIRISARGFEEGDKSWLRLTVEDNGPGIPEEVKARIFDPFFTTKRPEKGTGLGLSISHTIVTDHCGRLSVESEPGQGSRFHVDLPVDGRDQ